MNDAGWALPVGIVMPEIVCPDGQYVGLNGKVAVWTWEPPVHIVVYVTDIWYEPGDDSEMVAVA